MTVPDPRTASQWSRTHALLCSGVPLSLLMDLASPSGPPSAELYDAELPDRSRRRVRVPERG